MKERREQSLLGREGKAMMWNRISGSLTEGCRGTWKASLGAVAREKSQSPYIEGIMRSY